MTTIYSFIDSISLIAFILSINYLQSMSPSSLFSDDTSIVMRVDTFINDNDISSSIGSSASSSSSSTSSINPSNNSMINNFKLIEIKLNNHIQKLTDSIIGELMPFSPLDACQSLQPSLFTILKNNLYPTNPPLMTSTNSSNSSSEWIFNPIIPNSKIICLIISGNCSMETKMMNINKIPNIVAAIFVNENDDDSHNHSDDNDKLTDLEIPIPVEKSLHGLLPFLIQRTNGILLIKLANYLRFHLVSNSDPFFQNNTEISHDNNNNRSINSSTLTPNPAFIASVSANNASLISSSSSLVESQLNFINDNNIRLAILNASKTNSSIWLMSTLYYSSHDAAFGIVEFCLVLIVVLLTVAFLTSVVLHCYFYHSRQHQRPFGRRRNRRNHINNETGLDEESASGTNSATTTSRRNRRLLTADQLNLLPLGTFEKFKTSAQKSLDDKENEPIPNVRQDHLPPSPTLSTDQHSQHTSALSSHLQQSNININSQTSTCPVSSGGGCLQSSTLLSVLTEDINNNRISLTLPKRASIHFSGNVVPVNDTCPICLEEFNSMDELRELPCYHVYHPSCIDSWLLGKCAKCPMCKFDVYASLKKLEEQLNCGSEMPILNQSLLSESLISRGWNWFRFHFLPTSYLSRISRD